MHVHAFPLMLHSCLRGFLSDLKINKYAVIFWVKSDQWRLLSFLHSSYQSWRVNDVAHYYKCNSFLAGFLAWPSEVKFCKPKQNTPYDEQRVKHPPLSESSSSPKLEPTMLNVSGITWLMKSRKFHKPLRLSFWSCGTKFL